ncbi:MAG: cyclase family protein [Limnochordaceae bacterium]|nr:cyclase family protein [Limnochordaceae bacterium]
MRLLLRTANSARSLLAAPQFHPDFVGLLPDAADLLVRHGVALIGIDYLSIEPYEQSIGSAPVHRRLLAAGIAIVEGIDLRQVAAGWYELIVLPLRLPGAEASPVRALLRPLI